MPAPGRLRRHGGRQRHDLLLQGVRREQRNGEGAKSNEAARPRRPRRTDGAAADPRRLQPRQREPLSDAGRWTNAIIGRARAASNVSSNQLACSKTTTCTAWRNNASTDRTPRSGRGSRRCPGATTSSASMRDCRAGHCRLRGYMLRRTSSRARRGLPRAHRQRRHLPRLTSSRSSLPATPPPARQGLDARGLAHDGSVVAPGLVSDSTYGAPAIPASAFVAPPAARRLRGADDRCAAARHRATDRAGHPERERDLRARSTSSGGGDRQCRRDPVPDRALPGGGLLELRRDRHDRCYELPDTGLSCSTAYSYRVRAQDAVPNLGLLEHGERYDACSRHRGTHRAGLIERERDQCEPDRPVVAAATDNVAVTQYRIERCQGAGCSNFVEIATTALRATELGPHCFDRLLLPGARAGRRPQPRPLLEHGERYDAECVSAPAEPLPTLDDFNRANENPLSDAGRWSNGIAARRDGPTVSSNQLACSKTTTCTAWRNASQYGPDTEVWAKVGDTPRHGQPVPSLREAPAARSRIVTDTCCARISCPARIRYCSIESTAAPL